MRSLQKPALIFDLDQAFSNGPIQTRDLVGLQRVIDTLKAFRTKYDVYALVDCDHTNKSHVQAVLDLFQKNHQPFLLDVYTSDQIQVSEGTSPWDASHGLAVSVEQLASYKKHYGALFAGLRIFEVYGMNFSILAAKYKGVHWVDLSKSRWPKDRFYQKRYMEYYLKFARSNGMFVFLGDFYWAFTHPWPFDTDIVQQPQNEQELRALLAQYPGTAIIAYDNNEPEGKSAAVLSTWPAVFRSYLKDGAKGFGLSDQAWIHDPETECPVETIITWAKGAFQSGASVVELEPYWYWWKFPRGSMGAYEDYTTAAEWSDRGAVTPNLQALATALGVTLPAP